MGNTVDEAWANARAALRDWIEHIEANHGAAPTPQTEEAIRTAHAEELADGARLATVALSR